MPRTKTGSIRQDKGGIYARITYTDKDGRRRDKRRKAFSRTHARQLIKEMLAELETRGEAALDYARMTFAQLAKHYLDNYLTEPEYVDNRKVRGLRTHKQGKSFMVPLKEFFGNKRIREITHGDLLRYKARRLIDPILLKPLEPDGPIRERQRSIASVNRELSLLRRMLNIAQREGWISRNPFHSGDSLISNADERKRERVLSRNEELLLLDACDEHRAHLKPIIICALDTGMRKGEILSLRWRDIDFPHRQINIQAFNTKTMRQRSVRMTVRLTKELFRLAESRKDLSSRVFGPTDSIKRSWTSACRIAGISGVRFHDLRHTCATRLVQGGMELSQVSHILGHTQIATTFRYANPDSTTLERAAQILDAHIDATPAHDLPDNGSVH